jgi:transcriptional regulator with XRE-family HTH domain
MSLGQRINKKRRESGLRGIDLAEKSGLSPGFISQIERNLVNPSVSTLKKIGNALNVPIGIFFEEESSKEETNEFPVNKSPVVYENQRKTLSPNNGVIFYLLNPDMSGDIEFILDIFEPGATTGEELYSHPGEECGLILEGELEVQLEDKKYLLKKGDSITFKSTILHRKTNTGKLKSISIWANAPPWF